MFPLALMYFNFFPFGPSQRKYNTEPEIERETMNKTERSNKRELIDILLELKNKKIDIDTSSVEKRFQRAKITCFTLFLIIVGVFRTILTPDIGLLHYFTNWAWLLHTIFFILVTIGFTKPIFEKFAIKYIMLTSYGTAWIVLIVITAVLWCDPGMINTEINTFNIYYVFTGHVVVHVIPLLLIILYFEQSANIIKKNLNAPPQKWPYIIWIIYQVFSPFILLLLYRYINDPHNIYGAKNMSEISGWFLAIATCFLTNGLRLYGIIIKSNPKKTEQLLHDEDDFIL